MTGVAPSRSRCVRARARGRGDLAGNGEHLAPLVEREVGGDQRAAAFARLDDDRGVRQPGDDPVARREAPRCGLDARRVLGDDQTRAPRPRPRATRGRADSRGRCRSRARRPSSPASRAPRCAAAVDAAGEPGHDDDSGRRELAPEGARDRSAVRRARPRADDRDARAVERARQAPTPRTKSPGGGSWIAARVAPGTRGRARPSHGSRRPRARRRYAASSKPAEKRSKRTVRGPSSRCVARRRREHRERRARSLRSSSARRAVGQRLGDVLGHDRSAPASAATSPRPARRVRARGPTAAAARPPASGARRASAPSAGAASRSRARAATTRSRTASDASPGGPASSSRAARGTVSDEIEPVEQRAGELLAVALHPLRRAAALRSGIAARAAGAEVHRRRPAESAPGNTARPATRATVTTPSSSGCRSASSAGRGNSGNSSRKSTPWCARLASPGRGADAPPPTIAGRRRRVVRRAKRRHADRAHRRAGARPRPNGCASPRAPRRRRAAAGSPAAGGPASSCRCRAGRRAAGCGCPPPRSRAPDAHAPGRARRRGRATARERPRRGGNGSGGSRSPRRYATASARWWTAIGSTPASATSGPDSAAQTSRLSPARLAPSAAISAPGTGRTPPVERELAERGESVERVERQLVRRGQHRERDREVEARALLAQARGRQVDRDPPHGPTRARPTRCPSGPVPSPPGRRGRRARRSRTTAAPAGGAPRPRPGEARGRRAHA